MAVRHESVNIGSRRRSRTSKKESGFRTHLAVYLCVGAFLFTLNLLTSPFHLWFYWPLFFWGWCLVLHAVIAYGADAPTRVPEVLRSLVPWLGDALPLSKPNTSRAAETAPFAAEAFAGVHERIERLKELTWHLPDGPVRAQAVRLCESADQIAATMAANRAAAEAVDEFAEDLLAPAESLLAQYVHAVDHGSSHPDDAFWRSAGHDLELLQTRLDALSGQWQRGRVVDASLAGGSSGAEPTAPQGMPLRS